MLSFFFSSLSFSFLSLLLPLRSPLSSLPLSFLIAFLSLSAISFSLSNNAHNPFAESLSLHPLPDASLLARFSFLWHAPHPPIDSLLPLPRALVELVDSHAIHFLQLSLSRGRTRLDRWPLHADPLWQGYPVGAHLAAAISPNSDPSLLANALAGLFCASLNKLALVPFNSHSLPISSQNKNTTPSLYHGLLPAELPCTENLSPLLSLLPCKSQNGLASLLDSHRLFNANWQSLRLKLLKKSSSLHVQIQFETVFDPARQSRKRDWSLSSVFGNSLHSSCPLANSSIIDITQSPGSWVEPRSNLDGKPINGKHSFDLMRAVFPLDIEMKWPGEEKFQYPHKYHPSPIQVKRLLIGYGQQRGRMGVQVKFNHHHQNSSLDENSHHEIIYFEHLPWWLSVYLHTLTVTLDGVRADLNQIVTHQLIKQPRSPLHRGRSLLMFYQFKIPRSISQMKIEFDYDKDLLLYTEYPSDANRGFDLNPALLIYDHQQLSHLNHSKSDPKKLNFPIFENDPFWSSSHDDGDDQNRYKFYWTSSSLIGLATPDFSMPYNVIIVTSTAIALFFGSVFNLLVRDFKIVKIVNTNNNNNKKKTS